VKLPRRPQAEAYVQSSIQFIVSDLDEAGVERFLEGCRARGVYLKWFGSREPKGYTSLAEQWRYIPDASTPKNTLVALSRLFDMRLPLGLTVAHCVDIAEIIEHELKAARTKAA
jgi:hypothetical protein